MHGDFSRDSYDSKNNFTRVLMQQGRLLVDADWNEQSAIVLNYLRTLAADIIGWYGGPESDLLLENLNTTDTFTITPGRYYVNGVTAKWDEAMGGRDEAGNPKPFKKDDIPMVEWLVKPDDANDIILIADIFERMVHAIHSDSIQDVAFGGLDTCVRQEAILRLRGLWVKDVDVAAVKERANNEKRFLEFISRKGREIPKLIAWTNLTSVEGENCVKDPQAGYTGLENQLYRVEVHHAGVDGKTFWQGDKEDNRKGAFTLKWSRDNGSVVYAATAGNKTATLKSKWRDETKAIRVGDSVELIPLSDETGSMVVVKTVSEDNGVVTIGFAQPSDATFKPEDTILVRRWDHQWRKDFPIAENGGFLVKEDKNSASASVEIPIEDGVRVRLSIPDGSRLEAGDHWLIPARATTGDIIWPRIHGATGSESYKPVPARYTEHHYAPIALIKSDKNVVDLRRVIKPVAQPKHELTAIT